MSNPALEREVMAQLQQLPFAQQRQVLDFARTLAMGKPSGVPGKELLAFAGAIELDDLRLMATAIEEGYEQVDAGSVEYPDEVIKELWEIREEHAAQFNYDLEAIALDLKKEQDESGREVVSFIVKKDEAAVDKARPFAKAS